jgi:hypothetical protein
MVETRQSGDGAVREGSYGGGGCPAPALARGLSGKVRRDLYAVIADEIDRLAGVHDIQRISFRQSPPAPQFWRAETAEMHPLLRHGYLDTSLATQVIDVSQAEGDLLKDMRKGHRYDVKRSQGLLNTQLFDRESISAERFQEYREMHHRAAGRVTRPPVTFQMMYEWILKGQAALACAELQGRSVGYAVISIYKDGAYYSSSCEEPGLGDLPIGHAMQWAVVRWLRTHGFRNYEIGIQPNGQIHNLMSEKELKIALFKRGFGGGSGTCWAGETC